MKRKTDRIGMENYNYQGCLMRIIEYIDNKNIIVQFQDERKTEVCTRYKFFVDGQVKNPYYPEVYGVGIVGEKYSTRINKKTAKEYEAWKGMLRRCHSNEKKRKFPSYENVVCCKKWLYYPNFYEWIHSQENFDKWIGGERWAIDKDILIKGNKIYSPETCCLVPQSVNSLFVKENINRGNCPIGVTYYREKFQSSCNNPLIKKITIGRYNTSEEAFYVYKEYKENLIKEIAQEEYNKGNITKRCYDAMMKYEVEITD